MNCQNCDQPDAKASYMTLGHFFWDHICEHCKDRLKLQDWNESCRLIEENHAIHQTEYRGEPCHPSD